MASNEIGTPGQTRDNDITPPNRPTSELAWVMQGVNKLEEKFDKLDERLRMVENKISKATGWIMAGFAFLVLLQVALRIFNVSISLDK